MQRGCYTYYRPIICYTYYRPIICYTYRRPIIAGFEARRAAMQFLAGALAEMYS